MLCVFMVECRSVVVNDLCNLSVRTVVKLCNLGVSALRVSFVS